MEKRFVFTVGAMGEIAERCPNHDFERVYDLFAEEDAVKRLDNMIYVICVLNKWAIYKDTDTFDGAMTKNDILKLDITELNDLFDEAMTAMTEDRQPKTETEPTKKTKAASKSKS